MIRLLTFLLTFLLAAITGCQSSSHHITGHFPAHAGEEITLNGFRDADKHPAEKCAE